MIRTEAEYRNACGRLDAEAIRIDTQHRELERLQLSPEDIQRALDPVLSFHLQLKEEVASYERIRRGEFAELENFFGLGPMLIGMRIFLGMSQRDLARRLDIDESQVSRDERNEYRGITIERAQAILEAFGVRTRTKIDPPPTQELEVLSACT